VRLSDVCARVDARCACVCVYCAFVVVGRLRRRVDKYGERCHDVDECGFFRDIQSDELMTQE